MVARAAARRVARRLPRPRGRLVIGALAAVGLFSTLTGCGGPPPLGASGPVAGSVCYTLGTGTTFTLNDVHIRNGSRGVLTIQSVSLHDPVNVRLIGARLLFAANPHTGTLLGDWPSYPPHLGPATNGLPTGAKAVPALDARVPPSGDTEGAELLLGLRVLHPGQNFSFRRAVVTYDGLGAQWTWQGPLSYYFREHC